MNLTLVNWYKIVVILNLKRFYWLSTKYNEQKLRYLLVWLILIPIYRSSSKRPIRCWFGHGWNETCLLEIARREVRSKTLFVVLFDRKEVVWVIGTGILAFSRSNINPNSIKLALSLTLIPTFRLKSQALLNRTKWN